MKEFYSKFVSKNKDLIHYAAHSHHYWADVTFDAVQEYWNDSSLYVDEKWGHIFSQKIPKAQELIANKLSLSSGKNIVFAPNTHELVYRILTALMVKQDRPLKVLTSQSEFHSFSRQIKRLVEENKVELTSIEINSITEFKSEILAEVEKKDYDLFFVSHVFFDSGLSLGNLDSFLLKVKEKVSTVILDGYHGFCAIPTNLSKLEDSIIYLAGSYKYLGAGEGCCFAHIPQIYMELRPEYTGWFAELGELSAEKSDAVPFAQDVMRFAGSTMDFSSLYKLIAAFELFNKEGIDSVRVHQHVKGMQKLFIERAKTSFLNKYELIIEDLEDHGNFLTYKVPLDKIDSLHKKLKEKSILTDFRGDRLRFGFSIYQDNQTVEEFFQRVDAMSI